eukprot:1110949-Amphidinium_carterae.1
MQNLTTQRSGASSTRVNNRATRLQHTRRQLESTCHMANTDGEGNTAYYTVQRASALHTKGKNCNQF